MAELITTSLYADANLQEYYQLENLTGKNGNTLTNNGTATFVSAKYGNGVSGGSSDADKTLSLASALSYSGGAYSLSFWIKINTAPGSGSLYNVCELFEGTNDTSLLVEYENSGGTLRLVFHRLRVGIADVTVNYNIDLGTTNFHHIVFAYDGSTIKPYINNIAASTAAATGNGSSVLASKFNIMGGRNDNTTNNLLGVVDDFGLFNRELVAADVATLYNEQAGGYIFIQA